MALLDWLRQGADWNEQRQASAEVMAAQRLVDLQAQQLQPQATALARLLNAQGQTGAEGQAATRMMMNPLSRSAGIEFAERLVNSKAPLTPYQQAQVQNWQREAVESAERLALSREQLELRRRELEAGLAFREQTVAQSWERLGQQYRPTPQQGSTLAAAEYGISQLDGLLSAARPEYFGFLSENYGDAVLEIKNRIGSDVEFSAFWNLLDNLKIEINSGRFVGILSDQDIRMLNSVWAKRTDAPDLAFRKLGTMREIMQGKRNVAEQAIRYSGRTPPGMPEPEAENIPPPPTGYRMR